MPTSLATWRSESAASVLSSHSSSAASRIARRVRSLRSPRVSGHRPYMLIDEHVCTVTRADRLTVRGRSIGIV